MEEESIHTAKVNQGNEVKVVLGYGIEIPVEQNFEVRLTKKDGEEQNGTLHFQEQAKRGF